MLAARDVMATNVVTVLPEVSIKVAGYLLQLNKISGLPVVDHDRNLLGIVTEYDLLRFIADGGRDGLVRQIMQTAVATVPEELPITEVAHVLLRTRFRRIIVVRGRMVVGLVARRDVIFTQGILRELA